MRRFRGAAGTGVEPAEAALSQGQHRGVLQGSSRPLAGPQRPLGQLGLLATGASPMLEGDCAGRQQPHSLAVRGRQPFEPADRVAQQSRPGCRVAAIERQPRRVGLGRRHQRLVAGGGGACHRRMVGRRRLGLPIGLGVKIAEIVLARRQRFPVAGPAGQVAAALQQRLGRVEVPGGHLEISQSAADGGDKRCRCRRPRRGPRRRADRRRHAADSLACGTSRRAGPRPPPRPPVRRARRARRIASDHCCAAAVMSPPRNAETPRPRWSRAAALSDWARADTGAIKAAQQQRDRQQPQGSDHFSCISISVPTSPSARRAW